MPHQTLRTYSRVRSKVPSKKTPEKPPLRTTQKAKVLKASADTGSRRVGDLAVFGFTELWRVPTILPRRFHDLKHPNIVFGSLEAGQNVCIGGRPIDVTLLNTLQLALDDALIVEAGEADHADQEAEDIDDGQPYSTELVEHACSDETTLELEGSTAEPEDAPPVEETWRIVMKDIDGRNPVEVIVRTETRAHRAMLAKAAAGEAVWIFGLATHKGGVTTIVDADPVAESDLGEVHAYYPSKTRKEWKVPPGARRTKGKQPKKRLCITKLTSHQTGILVRDKNRLAISRCASVIKTRMHLADSLSEWELMRVLESPAPTIETTFKLAHHPPDIACGEASILSLERLAALEALQRILEDRERRPDKHTQIRITSRVFSDCVAEAARNSGFHMTHEQRFAAAEIVTDLVSPKRTHRMLSGDVGTGKTVVFLIPCACVALAGHLVAIIEPRSELAAQVFEVVRRLFPTLPAQLIAGDNKDELRITSGILVGTTAIWSRITSAEITPALVVADEQQKFGVSQRMPIDFAATNLLESTATAIPRSQALIQFGGTPITRLHHCHARKVIDTRVVQTLLKLEMVYEEVSNRIENEGCNLLLVFPVIDVERQPSQSEPAIPTSDPVESEETPKAVLEAVSHWSHRFPGAVGVIHGRMDHTERQAVLSGVKHGKIKVLIATSLIEVGLDLPRADQMVIHHPERFGVSAVHQLRGRLARQGGNGWCYLACGQNVSEPTLALLNLMQTEYDGFKLAGADMVRRGFGDIRRFARQQSGEYEGFLVDRPPTVDLIDWVANRCEKWLFPSSDRDLINDTMSLTQTMSNLAATRDRSSSKPTPLVPLAAPQEPVTPAAEQMCLFDTPA